MTTVFTGDVNLQTDGVQLGNAPHDFDYVFDFEPETEFVYDPSEGNLLVEFIFAGGPTWQDARGFGDGLDRFILALGTNPTAATIMSDAVSVTQFTIPEPSSAALLGVGLIGLLAHTRGARRHQVYASRDRCE